MPLGTIWSSSPSMTRVGTSNFLRSSVKSVSENALMLSPAFLRPACMLRSLAGYAGCNENFVLLTTGITGVLSFEL